MVHWCQLRRLTGTRGDVKLTHRKAFRVLLNMAGVSARRIQQTLTLNEILERVKIPNGILGR